MTSQLKTLLPLSVCATAVLGIGVWRYLVSGSVHPVHSVVVCDRSESVRSSCGCTMALVKRACSNPNVDRGSTVTISITGDASTAGEPSWLATVEAPVFRQVIEGRDSSKRKLDELIAELSKKCEATATSKVSPILLAIKRAVEHLQSLGCGPGTGCTVYVQTDLEETFDSRLRAILRDTSGKSTYGPPQINNDYIDVIISGIAETVGVTESSDGRIRRFTGPRDSARTEQIKKIWKAMFTNPDRVTFEPYCPAE